MDELTTARRAAHANAQRVTELEAELAYARPMADAAHAYCAANLAGADHDQLREPYAAMFNTHAATTPSPTPSSHVIVERAELERLRELARICGQGYLSGADGKA